MQLGTDMIRLPDDIVVPGENVEDLIQEIFGELPSRHADSQYTVGRAILTSTNANVDMINEKVTAKIPLPVR